MSEGLGMLVRMLVGCERIKDNGSVALWRLFPGRTVAIGSKSGLGYDRCHFLGVALLVVVVVVVVVVVDVASGNGNDRSRGSNVT